MDFRTEWTTAPRVLAGYTGGSETDVTSRARERTSDYRPATPIEFAYLAREYDELDVTVDPAARALWCHLKPKGPPSFTQGVLRDLTALRGEIHGLFDRQPIEAELPFLYFVMGSRIPGIYNLGGDLSYFASQIRSRNRETLHAYAYACIELTYQTWRRFGAPVVTIALVEGDALGGGFEAALAFDVIVAEEGAKFGLPEILFNLFPGMGAISFLSRRLDVTRARKMMLSGRVMSAAELHEVGIVDVVARKGQGETAVREYIAANARKHGAHRAVYDAARRVAPLKFEELSDVVDIWIEAAMRLDEGDLRRMERLLTAQQKRLAGTAPKPDIPS